VVIDYYEVVICYYEAVICYYEAAIDWVHFYLCHIYLNI